jgi:hypothetical protein
MGAEIDLFKIVWAGIRIQPVESLPRYVSHKETGPALLSAIAGGYAQVIYQLNEWAETPPHLAKLGYYLCGFDTIEHATHFFVTNFWPAKEFKIFQAVGVLPDFPASRSRITPSVFERIMDTKDWGPIGFQALREWPEGTVQVERLKLTREIDLNFLVVGDVTFKRKVE